MRKILMIVIAVLLVVLSYFSLTKGYEVFGIKISSIKQIEENNKELKDKIEEINTLIDTEYPKKIAELKTASIKLQTEKEEYLKYTNMSSDEEILNAMQKKSYAIEFLWAKIGTHARKEGVNLKLEIVSSSTGATSVNDLNFTVEGTYIGITNFIYAIENDSNLNFTIENFKLLPSNKQILQGTFTVRNIAIEGNTSQQSVPQESQNTNETNTNTTNTTTSDTASNLAQNAISNAIQSTQEAVTNSVQNNQ